MVEEMLTSARRAVSEGPQPGDPAHCTFIHRLRERLARGWAEVVRANETDLATARASGHPEALVERIRLTHKELDWLCELVDQVTHHLPSALAAGPEIRGAAGIVTRRLPKPLGVLFVVYEARPIVTAEATLLTVSTGNAVLLRAGKEIRATNAVLASLITAALHDAKLPTGLVHVLHDPNRSALRALLKRHDAIDALIPRGSPTLVDYCREHSQIPVIASGGGVNHMYVHRSADVELAADLVLDSKLSQPAGCTAVEMVLADAEVAEELLAALLRRAAQPDSAPFVLRVPPEAADQLRPAAGTADLKVTIEVIEDTDNGREFLDRTLAVRVVNDVGQAIDHIRRYGSGHTEGMIGTDPRVVNLFCARVDAACLVVNGSLRLDDGPTMGLGPELSISTGRLHVRGPVTLGALLTHSWVVHGHGATRPEQADPQWSLPEQADPKQNETEQAGCAELPMRGAVSEAVRRLVLRESRSPLSPQDIGEDEPLNGTKLRVNSFGFVGMLVHLEDELKMQLPDDLFVGRRFDTVGDLIDLVGTACARSTGGETNNQTTEAAR